MANPALFDDHRLIIYYKGDISALLLFAQHQHGSISFPTPLPTLSTLLKNRHAPTSNISLHPCLLLNALNQCLNFDDDLLKIDTDFLEQVETPNGIITIQLARFMLLDPPHKLMQQQNHQLRTLTELRRQSELEMALLQRAYSKIMES